MGKLSSFCPLLRWNDVKPSVCLEYDCWNLQSARGEIHECMHMLVNTWDAMHVCAKSSACFRFQIKMRSWACIQMAHSFTYRGREAESALCQDSMRSVHGGFIFRNRGHSLKVHHGPTFCHRLCFFNKLPIFNIWLFVNPYTVTESHGRVVCRACTVMGTIFMLATTKWGFKPNPLPLCPGPAP
jgi:hypothetical protein